MRIHWLLLPFGNMYLALLWLTQPMMVHGQTATATASAPAEPGNNLRGGPNDVHALLLDEAASAFREGLADQVEITTRPTGVSIAKQKRAGAAAGEPRTALYISRIVQTPFPFNDVVPSWNVDTPEGTGFEVELRFGRKADDFWTPYYFFGIWGTVPTIEHRIIEDENGVIDVDTFRSHRAFDRIQYRVLLATTVPDRSPVIRRIGMAYSNTLDDEALARRFRPAIDPGPKSKWARRLPVPWRSQAVEDESLRHSICSPASVAMVLQYYGINEPTAKVAARVYDDHYRIYGNWIRAVQGAYSYGVPGYLERFGSWDAVKRHIAQGRPVIAGIRVDKGDLRHAPYRSTDGHLIVIVGFDENGNVCVNDPAAKTVEAGTVTYDKDDMKKVWLDHGGVGYVLLGRVADK